MSYVDDKCFFGCYVNKQNPVVSARFARILEDGRDAAVDEIQEAHAELDRLGVKESKLSLAGRIRTIK